MRNIVLDTNCLLVCLASGSEFHVVWTAFLNEKYRLCVSNEVLTEYEEILAKKISPAFADMVIQVILNSENVAFVHPTFRFNLISTDPDDNKFVDCAVVANADYIVTNDKHFNVLKSIPFPPIKVIDIEAFKDMLV